MKHFSDHNIQAWNTFNLDVKAANSLIIEHEDDYTLLPSVLQPLPEPYLVIGGGSNTLFCDDFQGTIIKIETKGISVAETNNDTVLLSVAAGEEWEDVINFCLEKNYGGLENLTMIPGQAGSSAVQNIGAYGVEVGDVIEKVDVISVKDGSGRTFLKEECDFSYRHSVFKTVYAGQFIVSRVYFRLWKNPVVNITYGSVSTVLDKHGVKDPSIKDMVAAIREIRNAKLPDTKELGSAGSFFKNPVVTKENYESLQKEYPDIPGYVLTDGCVKLAAGWLIDKAGWKGFRRGDAGVYPHQALVLVNYGAASGREIFNLSEEIREDVKNKYNVLLEREVQVIAAEYK